MPRSSALDQANRDRSAGATVTRQAHPGATASAAAELDVGALYAEHGEFVLRVIERLTGPGAHVDDLLQECFVAAFKARRQYSRDRAAVTTWLYGIAANISRRHQRGRWRWQRLQWGLSLEQRPIVASAEQGLEQVERAALVHEVLAKLPFKQREVLALFELEGVDGPTIAAMVGIPEATVWTRLHHARKNFTKRARQRLALEARS